MVPINNKSGLVQFMAWCRTGDIIWTKDGTVHWRIYTPPGLNELIDSGSIDSGSLPLLLSTHTVFSIIWVFLEGRLNEIFVLQRIRTWYFTPLSHTWVRYPGFWGHGVKCPILTTVVPGFPAIWLAVPFGANGAHLGICTLPEKNIFCVWNKLFLGEIKFSQGRTRPVKSLWWQIVPMQESTNEWKNLTIF